MTDTNHRLTIQEASNRLGLAQDSIRKRIRRGVYQSTKDAKGRVIVDIPDQEINGTQGPAELQRRVATLEQENEYLRREKDELRALLRLALEDRNRS